MSQRGLQFYVEQRVKLTEKEAAVLASVELSADAPMSRIRKQTGLREHTIRHALRSLVNKRVATPVPFINLHRLGLTVYTLFFTVGGQKSGGTEALLKTFISAPEVLWVGEFGGEYQYGIAFASKRFSDFAFFLDEISRAHGSIFHDKAVSVEISFTLYPRGYLSPSKNAAKPQTATFDKQQPVSIDFIDEKILSALTSLGTLSHRQIALKIDVPLSTVELRIRKLKDQGVIVSEIYSVDASKFEMQTFKLLIYTKGLDGALTLRIHQYCCTQPTITALIECLGSWGYEINVEVKKPEELSRIIQQLYELFGNSIHTIKTLTKFSYPKVRFFSENSPLKTDEVGFIKSPKA